jgi:DNA-binding response OmpR family regulator
MRVLIVEDNADIAPDLGAFLKPRGYRPDVARNG